MAIISISGRAGSGKNTVGKIIQYLMYDHKNKLETVNQKGSYYWSVDLFIQDLKDDNVNLNGDGWDIMKWADPLHEITAVLLNVPLDFTYTDEFKQMLLPDWWNYEIFNHFDDLLNVGSKIGWQTHPMTGRKFLQRLNTDAIRNHLHENTWINALMAKYKPIDDSKRASMGNVIDYSACKWPNWIITDTCFPNQLAAVEKRIGSVNIKVERRYSNKPIFIGDDADGCTAQMFEDARIKPTSETALDDVSFMYGIINDGTLESLIDNVRLILVHAKLLPE